MRIILMAMCAAVLAGCGATRTLKVSVPVPVACNETVPQKPEWPTQSLSPGAAPFVVMRAALAEIDRREGWETELVAALRACTAPVQ